MGNDAVEITDDGFIVKGPTNDSLFNANNYVYYYYAMPQSVTTGTYTGNGTSSQTISLGFRPAVVGVLGTTSPKPEFVQIDVASTDNAVLNNVHYTSSGLGSDNDGQTATNAVEITDDGFVVKGNATAKLYNHQGSLYYYYAIPATTASGGSVDESEEVRGISDYMQYSLTTDIESTDEDVVDGVDDYRYYYL